MKRLILSFALFTLGGSIHADAQTFSAINQKNLKHPYLYFNDQDKRLILDYIRNDKAASGFFESLKLRAKILMHADVEKNNFPEINEGNPDNARDALMRRTRSAPVLLAFLYQMTGDVQYARKAFEFADALCEMPRWTNRFHQFRIIYDRVWPYNCQDDQTVFSVDLDVTNTGLALAKTYDWLYPALSQKEKDRIRGALLEKVILPVKGHYQYFWWSSAYKCNWCSVCNSNIGVAAMSLLTENPELEGMIREAYERTSKTLDHCGEDGGWQEGVSYLNYAVVQAVGFAGPLKRLTDGQTDLFKHPTLKQGYILTEIYSMIAPQFHVNFEDCSGVETAQIHILNKIADETGNGKAAWFRRHRLGEPDDLMDLVWRESKVKPETPEPLSHLFKSVGWAVLRTDFLDSDKPVLFCKAGMNDDPHHGHLDCGTYSIWWKGEGYVAELGSGKYDEDYFTEKRWNSPYASNAGHQTIGVNGEKQIPAKTKNQPWKEVVGGEILQFNTGKNRDYVLLDPTNAYPKNELKKWRRHVIFEKPDVFVILDEISAKPKSNIEMIFNTQVRFENKNNHMLLHGKNGNMILFPVSKTAFHFENKLHQLIIPENSLIKNGQISRIPYFTAELTSKDQVTSVFTIIAPYENEESISKMIASAKLLDIDLKTINLSIAISGKDYQYHFSRSQDGSLVLVDK